MSRTKNGDVPVDDVHRAAASLLDRVGDGGEIPIEVLHGFVELVLRSELVAGSRQVLDGPHLRELAESVFSRLTDELSDRATELSRGESHFGKLLSKLIVARK